MTAKGPLMRCRAASTAWVVPQGLERSPADIPAPSGRSSRRWKACFPLLPRRALARHPEKGEVQLPVMVADMLDRGRAQVRVLSSGEKWFGCRRRS